MTRCGPLDVVFSPDGADRGYEDLAESVVQLDLGDQRVMVVTVAAWEALKQAAGRAKDLEHLDQYYENRPKPDE